MLRGFRTIALILMAAAEFAAPAAAQNGCPPGETFVTSLNRCLALGGGSRCPPGMTYDTGLRRCLGMPEGAGRAEGDCPAGQQFDASENRCAAGTAPPSAPPAAPGAR